MGGPKHEFFHLCLLSAMCNPTLFKGRNVATVPTHSMSGLMGQHFHYVGNLIAMSIVHGGPGPSCFAERVYSYTCSGFDGIEVSLDNVTDVNI